jgi:hypothetical protein
LLCFWNAYAKAILVGVLARLSIILLKPLDLLDYCNICPKPC